jgi:hypothetical protein
MAGHRRPPIRATWRLLRRYPGGSDSPSLSEPAGARARATRRPPGRRREPHAWRGRRIGTGDMRTRRRPMTSPVSGSNLHSRATRWSRRVYADGGLRVGVCTPRRSTVSSCLAIFSIWRLPDASQLARIASSSAIRRSRRLASVSGSRIGLYLVVSRHQLCHAPRRKKTGPPQRSRERPGDSGSCETNRKALTEGDGDGLPSLSSVSHGPATQSCRRSERFSGHSGDTLPMQPQRDGIQKPRVSGVFVERRRPESNRCRRLCRPLRSHSATSPGSPISVSGREGVGRSRMEVGDAARIHRWPDRLWDGSGAVSKYFCLR